MYIIYDFVKNFVEGKSIDKKMLLFFKIGKIDISCVRCAKKSKNKRFLLSHRRSYRCINFFYIKAGVQAW